MAFKTVEAPETGEPRKPLREYPDGPDGLIERLRDEIRGQPDDYYTDLAQRILVTAATRALNLQSVLDAFITGAQLRGEDIRP